MIKASCGPQPPRAASPSYAVENSRRRTCSPPPNSSFLNPPVHPRKPSGYRGRAAADTLAYRNMDAEFIAVSGPRLGERFPLGPADVRIGRAPASEIQLSETEAAWEHCFVRARD